MFHSNYNFWYNYCTIIFIIVEFDPETKKKKKNYGKNCGRQYYELVFVVSCFFFHFFGFHFALNCSNFFFFTDFFSNRSYFMTYNSETIFFLITMNAIETKKKNYLWNGLIIEMLEIIFSHFRNQKRQLFTGRKLRR